MIRIIVYVAILCQLCCSHDLDPYSTNSSTGELMDTTVPGKNRITAVARNNKQIVEQKVVLLAGPHKTASSSIQYNILHWIQNKTITDWSWPAPSDLIGLQVCQPDGIKPKIFYPYYRTLLGGLTRNKCLPNEYKERGLSKEAFTSAYENAFAEEWRKGHNLVIGSEAMDFVNSLVPVGKVTGAVLLDRIIAGLPWNINGGRSSGGSRLSIEDITVVVKLRTPRVEHLISLWHQCCMVDMSFHDYLTTRLPSKLNGSDSLRSLDSLRLAEMFLERGLNVVLIDMEGASNRNQDISDVIACDILGARCTENKQMVTEKILPTTKNMKTHEPKMLQVSEHQLEQIDQAIRNYDCNYQRLLQNKNITIMYPDILAQIFDECKNILKLDRIRTRDQLVESLRNIVTHTDDSMKDE